LNVLIIISVLVTIDKVVIEGLTVNDVLLVVVLV
jgi:hypothetical protein